MILDAFYSVIKADTSDLKRGMSQSKKSTDEVVDSLRETQAEAEDTTKSMGLLAKGALAWLATLVSIGSTVSATLGRIDENNLLGQTAKSLQSGVEDVDAFRRSVRDMGGTVEGAESSLTALFQSMGRAIMEVDSSQAKVFQRLGINLRNADGTAKGATDTMLDLAGALEGLDRARAQVMLTDLGISDQRTVDLLLQGRDAVEAATQAHKESGVVTAEMAAGAARLTAALNKLRSGTDRIKMAFDMFLLPALEVAVEWLTVLVDWVDRNQRTVTIFFAAIAGTILAVYLPAMAAAAAATIAATWPFIAIGAAVAAAAAAFALIYDDIMAFVQGNESMIGQIFDEYPMIESVVMGVVDAFRFMYDILSSVVGVAADFFQFAWAKQFELISKGVDKIKGLFNWGSDDIKVAQEMMLDANSSPLNATTSNAISNATSTTNENNLTVGELKIVTAATDAAGIARDARSELQGQLENMAYEMASGVAR